MALDVDDIEDIKQLITANNGVLLAEFKQQMDETLDEKLTPIKQQIQDLTDFVTHKQLAA